MQSEFLVEHTRLELVTPTLPVLCAPNCANAPLLSHYIRKPRGCQYFYFECDAPVWQDIARRMRM